MKQNYLVVIVAALFLCCMCVPVSAVIQEVTLKGAVATFSQPKNTITIEHPQQYGCTYPASGAPVCTYTPMSVEVLTGTVPDAAAFSVFKTGDPVVATSLGGAGETWITLAKLYGSRPNEEYVTDIVGDMSTIPTPLIGNYALDATTVPDCSACTGTTCTATSANVKVMSEGKEVSAKILKPGESFTYNGRNDGSSVAVTFVKGQALSASCPGKAGMTGSQAISVYVVKVVPPIGTAQVNIRTATTTRPDEALTPLTPLPPIASTPIPTTKSSMLPFAAIGAIGLAGLVLVMRKE
ncbi:MAG: hypothetical protein WC626_11130 [Methanoregula sp.]